MFRFLPDPEQALIDALTPVVGVPVATREPAPRLPAYIRLFQILSTPVPVPTQERVTFTVEAWHKTRETEALRLAQTIRTALARWGWERGITLTSQGITAQVKETTVDAPTPFPSADGWARYTLNASLTITH